LGGINSIQLARTVRVKAFAHLSMSQCGEIVTDNEFLTRRPQNASLARAREDPDMYFRDGVRRIDMVLAYEDDQDDTDAQRARTAAAAKPPDSASSLEQRMVADNEEQDNSPPISLSSEESERGDGRNKQEEEINSGNDAELTAMKREARAIFERNLVNAGLELEYECAEESFDRRTHFLKIHAPKETLERGAEVIGMRAPVREFIVTSYSNSNNALGGPVSALAAIFDGIDWRVTCGNGDGGKRTTLLHQH